MSCENPLNIASTPYVDCTVATVSGHLQNEIDSIVPGVWAQILNVSGSLSNVNSVFTTSSFPAMDMLQVFVRFDDLYISNDLPVLHTYANEDLDITHYSDYGTLFSIQTLNEELSLMESRYQLQGYIANSADKLKLLYNSLGYSITLDDLGEITFADFNDPSGLLPHFWKNTTDPITSFTFSFSHSVYGIAASGSVSSIRVKVFGMNF
jgi:hypothetical protein